MKKKIILLLVVIAFCSGCGKSNNQSNGDTNNNQQNSSENENIGSDASQSGIYHYSDSDITPERELESGEVLLGIGSKEFNLLDLTVGEVLNNFNSSTGFTSKHIIDKENYNPDEVGVFEKYQEDQSNVFISFSIDNEGSYKDSDAKEKFLHKIIHEITISVNDTVLSSDFSSNISVQGISIGMTRDEVHSILGEPSSTSSIIGDRWYVNYRYTDTKSWLKEHFGLSVRYNDNNQVISMYISI